MQRCVGLDVDHRDAVGHYVVEVTRNTQPLLTRSPQAFVFATPGEGSSSLPAETDPFGRGDESTESDSKRKCKDCRGRAVIAKDHRAPQQADIACDHEADGSEPFSEVDGCGKSDD